MINTAITLASAEAHTWSGVNPYVVGGGMLVIFFAMLGILISFGAGRDHS